jgi:hypothetical protein
MTVATWILWTQLTLLTMPGPGTPQMTALDAQPLPHAYTTASQCQAAAAQANTEPPVVTQIQGTVRVVRVTHTWCVATPIPVHEEQRSDATR